MKINSIVKYKDSWVPLYMKVIGINKDRFFPPFITPEEYANGKQWSKDEKYRLPPTAVCKKLFLITNSTIEISEDSDIEIRFDLLEKVKK